MTVAAATTDTIVNIGEPFVAFVGTVEKQGSDNVERFRLRSVGGC